MNKIFIRKIKKKLLEEKKELLSKTIIVSNVDAVDLEGDEIDEIQGALLIEMQNKIATRNSEKISKIDDALKRIEASTYGICEDCEIVIPEKRVDANPYVLTCVSCAEDREIINNPRKI